MSLIDNERVKLTATYMNGVAIAVIAIGSLAPLFSYIYSTDVSQPLWVVAIFSIICAFVSAALHYGARRTLGRLQP
jgi:hypothetical protein